MARLQDREKALSLRTKGMSYSQIKEKLGISKSTLHYWLRDYPLSEARIRELRDHSAQRIKRFRATMLKKRETRIEGVTLLVKKRIKTLSDRELFLAGLFLYWAEGSKSQNYTVALHNTDPSMLRCFIRWLYLLGIPKSKIKIRLQIYADMSATTQINFWAKILKVSTSSFGRVQVKKTDTNKRTNYKGRFGFGTCSVVVYDRDLSELVMSSISVLRSKFMKI